MLRINALRHILEPVGQNGNHQPFKIKFIKKSTGELDTSIGEVEKQIDFAA